MYYVSCKIEVYVGFPDYLTVVMVPCKYFVTTIVFGLFAGPRSHYLREAAAGKKISFLSGPATKALSRPPSPPIGLVAIGTFFLALKKVLFSFVAHPLSSPLLVAGSLR